MGASSERKFLCSKILTWRWTISSPSQRSKTMEENRPETTASILAEMRKGHTCNLPFAYMIGEGTPAVVDPIAKEFAEPAFKIRKVTVGELADRLENAIKRELGNVAAMREAMEKVRERLVSPYITEEYFQKHSTDKPIVDIIDAALENPPRNCDVGSAEEQSARFDKFCNSNYNPNDVDAECWRCQLFKTRNKCEFAWAQMPYLPVTEGGFDGSKQSS